MALLNLQKFLSLSEFFERCMVKKTNYLRFTYPNNFTEKDIKDSKKKYLSLFNSQECFVFYLDKLRNPHNRLRNPLLPKGFYISEELAYLERFKEAIITDLLAYYKVQSIILSDNLDFASQYSPNQLSYSSYGKFYYKELQNYLTIPSWK
jgi:hypothetical protein